MNFSDTKNLIINEISSALDCIKQEDVAQFIKMMDETEKIFFVGVGRVMLSLKSIAKRFSHLGYDCHCVGDICEPAITERDLLIVGSGSGSTLFPLGIAKKAKKYNAKIVHIGSNSNSELREITDLLIRIPVRTKQYLEDESDSKQPMTSLFEHSLLVFGDTIAKMLIDEKEIDLKSLWNYHANLE